MNKHIVQVEEIAELKRKALHMKADQKLFVDLDVFKERTADTFLHVLFIVTTIATFYPLEMVGRKLIQYEYLSLLLIVPTAVLIYTAYQGLYYQCAVSRLKTEGQIEFFDIKKFAEKMGDLHADDARRIFFKD